MLPCVCAAALQGIQVHLLTGDNKATADAIARELAIPSAQVRVSRFNDCMMRWGWRQLPSWCGSQVVWVLLHAQRSLLLNLPLRPSPFHTPCRTHTHVRGLSICVLTLNASRLC